MPSAGLDASKQEFKFLSMRKELLHPASTRWFYAA